MRLLGPAHNSLGVTIVNPRTRSPAGEGHVYFKSAVQGSYWMIAAKMMGRKLCGDPWSRANTTLVSGRGRSCSCVTPQCGRLSLPLRTAPVERHLGGSYGVSSGLR